MTRHCAAWLLCWLVSASVIRTIDGDTAVFAIDIWPGLTGTGHVRVLDVDTPEMKGATRAAAERARDFTQAWLNKGEVLLAVGCGRPPQDSFGRYLGVVTRDGQSLADELIAAGHGVKR
jgi:endonuclease YncB( thermonuclease family)